MRNALAVLIPKMVVVVVGWGWVCVCVCGGGGGGGGAVMLTAAIQTHYACRLLCVVIAARTSNDPAVAQLTKSTAYECGGDLPGSQPCVLPEPTLHGLDAVVQSATQLACELGGSSSNAGVDRTLA